MPRPNHPTQAELDRALDGEAYWRGLHQSACHGLTKWLAKCLEVEGQRDELLTALEDIARSAQARQLAPGLREIAEEAIEDNRQRRA